MARIEHRNRMNASIWGLWALSSLAAWAVFHPAGSDFLRDALQFSLGGALATLLHGWLLARLFLRGGAARLWRASAGIWFVFGLVVAPLPWDRLSEDRSEGIYLLGLLGVTLAAGLLQWLALRRAAHGMGVWIVLPALAVACGFALTGVGIPTLAAPLQWGSRLGWGLWHTILGALFGLIYGVFTGTALRVLLRRPAETEHSESARIGEEDPPSGRG